MNVEYSDKVKQRAEDYALLQQATKSLEEVLEANAATVKAVWDRTDDPNEGVRYTLWISDGSDSASCALKCDELTWPDYLAGARNLLWDNVVQPERPQTFPENPEHGRFGALTWPSPTRWKNSKKMAQRFGSAWTGFRHLWTEPSAPRREPPSDSLTCVGSLTKRLPCSSARSRISGNGRTTKRNRTTNVAGGCGPLDQTSSVPLSAASLPQPWLTLLPGAEEMFSFQIA